MTDQVVNTSSANKYESTGSAASTPEPEPYRLVLLSYRLSISKTYL
ncbi:hypothetical protein [Neptunomonas phycophila]|nr:hypothetical protein [Neptunomonas phycophila]